MKRSMQVSRYAYPLEGGRGPTRSMWMWSGSGFHLRSQLLQISHRGGGGVVRDSQILHGFKSEACKREWRNPMIYVQK